MINEFTRQFTEYTVPNVVKILNSYYQIEPALNELMKKADANLNRKPVSAGVFLGEGKGKRFMPSIALLDIIGNKTDKWIVVDDKAEWLFLCGRDVFAGSIIQTNVRSGLAIVLNKEKEVLGYGKITGDMRKKEEVCLKNILDRGDYLRREMKKRKKQH